MRLVARALRLNCACASHRAASTGARALVVVAFGFTATAANAHAAPRASQQKRATTAAAQQPAKATRQNREKQILLQFCQDMDKHAAATIEGIRDRTDCWKRMQLEGMGDSTVNARYQAAVDDYDAASRSEPSRRAQESAESVVEQRMGEAQRALAAKNYSAANAAVDAVLTAQPQNIRAHAFKDRIVALERADRLRTTVFYAGGGVLALAMVLGVWAQVSARGHRKEIERAQAKSSQRQAIVEIIDGLGRGKLYAINGPVFRIGAALSDRPEEKNDLILSDEQSLVSRYHCAIIRKDGHYYLIDSSLNGTYIDDDQLERGEPRLLEDGDEFTVSGMARLKFLLV